MSMPFYVSPEQVMADKAEFARKGIARGKSIVAIEHQKGILMVAENATSLSKIGEIYDRIAFAGVGKFSEFDQLRKVGIRYADMKGYSYSRDDVRGKSLANAYSQAIGDVFTNQMKPLEVEIVVVEVGDPRFDGRFFTGVKTTGIYCRPVCPAVTPRRKNVEFYSCAAAAEKAGFRPCKRCKPEQPSLAEQHLATVAAICKFIEIASVTSQDPDHLVPLVTGNNIFGQ